jgi:hypothetical protein
VEEYLFSAKLTFSPAISCIFLPASHNIFLATWREDADEETASAIDRESISISIDHVVVLASFCRCTLVDGDCLSIAQEVTAVLVGVTRVNHHA